MASLMEKGEGSFGMVKVSVFKRLFPDYKFSSGE
jgi:hypothetical protein